MAFTSFIGIDVSKLTIDSAIYVSANEPVLHQQFENRPSGFRKLLAWLYQHRDKTQLLFCLEHTGIYALPLIDTRGRLITPIIYDEAHPFDQATTRVERFWLPFELSLAGTEHFLGFSYTLNAVLIMVGLLLFIGSTVYFTG